MEVSARSRIECSKKCAETKGGVMCTFQSSLQGPPGHCRLHSQLQTASDDKQSMSGAKSMARRSPCDGGYVPACDRYLKAVKTRMNYTTARRTADAFKEAWLWPSHLQRLAVFGPLPATKKVDNHFVLFNNNETQEERAQKQVKQLMLAVNDNLKRTNHRPFEHEIFRRCYQTIMTNAKKLVRKMGGSLTMESARLLLLDKMTGNNVTHQVLQDILDRGADDSKKMKDLEAEKDHLATRVEQANIIIAELRDQLKANDDDISDKAEKLGKAGRKPNMSPKQTKPKSP
ncbi:hypothetical protein ACOMHN_051290 [Nucella lapillus]